MKTRWINLMGIMILLCLALQACGTTPLAAPTAVPPQPPAATQPAAVAPTATNPPTQPPATQPPAPTATPAPTQIQHLTRPDEPVYIVEQTTLDCTIGRTYVSDQPVVIPPACDNQANGYIERPVTTDTKDYLPYLDIGHAMLGGNAKWIYARIELYDAVAEKGTGDIYYFFKLH